MAEKHGSETLAVDPEEGEGVVVGPESTKTGGGEAADRRGGRRKSG